MARWHVHIAVEDLDRSIRFHPAMAGGRLAAGGGCGLPGMGGRCGG